MAHPAPQPVNIFHVSSPAAPVTQQPASVVIQPNLTDIPGRMKCKYCSKEVVTVTKPVNGAITWTVFGVLLLLGIWPCCVIPFFVSSCKDIEHSCPSCTNIIFIYKRM
ncbi:LITAF domain-containing protein-like [Salminus brasiliensis]|uniref:LITAF domain-containing protein-like n=1 Tax=Salminus brasiliensis TaxID=930266 RepID=UPI003B837332